MHKMLNEAYEHILSCMDTNNTNNSIKIENDERQELSEKQSPTICNNTTINNKVENCHKSIISNSKNHQKMKKEVVSDESLWLFGVRRNIQHILNHHNYHTVTSMMPLMECITVCSKIFEQLGLLESIKLVSRKGDRSNDNVISPKLCQRAKVL